MSADAKVSWSEAKVDQLRYTSLYLAKVRPVQTIYPEASGLIYCEHGAPKRLEMPIAMQWASFESLDREIMLKYLEEDEQRLGITSFNNHIRAVQTVLGVRNLAAFGQMSGFNRGSLFGLSSEVKKESGYRLYRKHGIGADTKSQLLLVNYEGDKVNFGDFWSDVIKPIVKYALDPEGKISEVIDGYSRRFLHTFKLFLEPVNYENWKRQVIDSLTA